MCGLEGSGMVRGLKHQHHTPSQPQEASPRSSTALSARLARSVRIALVLAVIGFKVLLKLHALLYVALVHMNEPACHRSSPRMICNIESK